MVDGIRARPRWAAAVLALAAVAVAWLALRRGPSRGRPSDAPILLLAPRQEALVEAALGRGASLPLGCSLLDARVAAENIVARYACPEPPQPVAMSLYLGPAAGRPTNGSVGRFAVWTPPGFPPPLLRAVLERFAERQRPFVLEDSAATVAPRPGPRPRGALLPTLRALEGAATQDPAMGLLGALVFLLAFVWRMLRAEARGVGWALAAIVVAGAALRLGLAVEAPMNAFSFSRVLPLAAQVFRGPLLGWYTAHAGADVYFTTVQAWSNFALAACMPLVFFAHARLLLGDARSALVAALLMAFLPMHIRFARSDVSFIASLLDSSFTFVALYGWLTDRSRAWRLACLALLPVMALATYQARAENIVFVALDLGALGLYLGRGAPRHRVLVAAAVTLAVGAYCVVTDLLVRDRALVSEGLRLATLVNAVVIFFNARFNTLVNAWMTPPLLPLLALAGGVTLWRQGERRRALFLAAWLATFFLVHSFVRPSTVAMQARDHLHLMSPFRLLAAAATPRVLALPRPAQAALLAWALLMPALHRGFIRDTAYTEMQEYAFLRRVRGRIAPSCTVLEFGPALRTPHPVSYGALRAERMTLALRRGLRRSPDALNLGVIAPTETRPDAPETLALSDDFVARPPDCLYFYESAACVMQSPTPGRRAPVCEAMHQRFALELIAEERHPVRVYDETTLHRWMLVGHEVRLWPAGDGRGVVAHLALYRVRALAPR